MLKRKLLRNIFVLIFFSTIVVTACGKKTETASDSVAKEEEKTTSSSGAISVEIPPMSSNGILYGVIISASEKSMILQSDMGTTVKLGLNKDIDITGAKEGIATGTAVRVEYEGKLEGTSTKKIKIRKVADSEKLTKLDKAALEMAGAIILAVEDKDQSTLARLCEYPLIFDTGKEVKIGSVQDFISLKRSSVFTRRLVSSISRTNLFVTNAYDDGFLLGLSRPNIVVGSTKEGYLITGFHYK
ncbi:MAG: hypothetical protein ACTTKY_01240 [Catonella sp.]